MDEIKKSFLEQRVEDYAEKQMKREYFELRKFCVNHPIGKYLEINEKRLFTDGGRGTMALNIFNSSAEAEGTNLATVLAERKKELVKKNTDELLTRLSNISYLFEEVGDERG